MEVKQLNELPAGRYFVSDPCYGWNDRLYDWSEMLTDTGYLGLFEFGKSTGLTKDYLPKEAQSAMVRFGGGQNCVFAGCSTEYGDGQYDDEDGNSYGVDAGMIGVKHESITDLSGYDVYKVSEDDYGSLGRFVTFDEPFRVYKEGSVIVIGHIRIDTDPNYDEEDEEEK